MVSAGVVAAVAEFACFVLVAAAAVAAVEVVVAVKSWFWLL